MTRRIIVRKYKDGYYHEHLSYRECVVYNPLDATDYSNCALYRDASDNGQFELVEFEIHTKQLDEAPVFSDSEVDELKAFMIGKRYGETIKVDDRFAWASNPFSRHNPAHEHWHRGFCHGMARNPANTMDDPHYMGELDDFIYPVKVG